MPALRRWGRVEALRQVGQEQVVPSFEDVEGHVLEIGGNVGRQTPNRLLQKLRLLISIGLKDAAEILGAGLRRATAVPLEVVGGSTGDELPEGEERSH